MLNRSATFKEIAAGKQWDILVAGGGATGLGIALEACTRGYSVLLLEQSDFAKGTSSRSTKLIHGGVRYLAKGDVGLVREAGTEREILFNTAPHLVKDLEFIIPVYEYIDRLKYGIGLTLYDWITGNFIKNTSGFMEADSFINSAPNLKKEGLRGAVVYHDGQFDDARMALNLAQTISGNGGFVANYCGVVKLEKSASGKVNAVVAKDYTTGELHTISTKILINATGVFADGIMKMDDPEAKALLRPSQGVHLVVASRFFPGKKALMIPKTSDERVLFAVPWHNRVILGTTDTPVNKISMEPEALEEEVKFILDTAAQYLNEPPVRKDVLSVYAGLRPLAASDPGKKSKEISRSHKIQVSPSGVLTMLGGKWTTYRKMAEDMINEAEKLNGWKKTETHTKNLKIHGAKEENDFDNPLYFYGSDYAALKELIDKDPGGWISRSIPLHKAQIKWAVIHEMAITIDDILSRRTRAILLDAKEALNIAPVVATEMSNALGKDKQWEKTEIENFSQIVKKYILT